MSGGHPLGLAPRDLHEHFLAKYGRPEAAGWAPRKRHAWGYYLPADYYEALVESLATEETAWLDVGAGADLFPSHRALGERLSRRVRRLVGVDPSDNIERNTLLHERVRCSIEAYRAEEPFDLVTLRMVAEHLADPAAVARALSRLVRPGGRVVVLTVHRFAPTTVISHLLPLRLHYPATKFLWGRSKADTFPTVYEINTRRRLRSLFDTYGFEERHFAYLPDLGVFLRFRWLNYLELATWRVLKGLRLPYPENCLLGVYERTDR